MILALGYFYSENNCCCPSSCCRSCCLPIVSSCHDIALFRINRLSLYAKSLIPSLSSSRMWVISRRRCLWLRTCRLHICPMRQLRRCRNLVCMSGKNGLKSCPFWLGRQPACRSLMVHLCAFTNKCCKTQVSPPLASSFLISTLWSPHAHTISMARIIHQNTPQ